MNYRNFGNDPPFNNIGDGKPQLNFPLTRQSSIYSLTIDEFQNTMGGTGKDFGSMNMDELLKNIWTAEEIQTMASTSAAAQEGGGGSGPGVYLQKQGSLTLPRTLSQKTVEEVWRDMAKEYGMGKDRSAVGGSSASNFPQKQHTLGEMTLEEFLFKAGVVREDAQLTAKPNNDVIFGNTNGLGISFQQQAGQNNKMMGNRIQNNHTQVAIQPSNLPLNINGIRVNQHQQPQPIFPKQPTVTYGQLPIPSNGQLGSPVTRGGILGTADQGLTTNLIQASALQGGGMGLVGLGAGRVTIANGTTANQVPSSDGIGKTNGDMSSSVSPVPYAFNGGLRGRRCGGAVEKVVERRQRRMIKNRESAARSRARKQIMQQNGNGIAI